MAKKTMLRQLIGKWGIMSIDMATALDSDMSVIHEDGTHEYIENLDEVDAVTVISNEAKKEPVKKEPEAEATSHAANEAQQQSFFV